MDQLKVEAERADRAEALVDTKAGLLAAERAISFSLALEHNTYKERLKRHYCVCSLTVSARLPSGQPVASQLCGRSWNLTSQVLAKPTCTHTV